MDVAAVQHRVLRRADVDERRLHAREHVLHAGQVHVAVDLRDVVGRPRHVVLDEVPALEDGDLGGRLPHVHAHRVAPDGAALALAAAPALERLLVELGRLVGDQRLDRPCGALGAAVLLVLPPLLAGLRTGATPAATAPAPLLAVAVALPVVAVAGLLGLDLPEHLGRDAVADAGLGGRRLRDQRGLGGLDAGRAPLAVPVGQLGIAIAGAATRAAPAAALGLPRLAATVTGGRVVGRRGTVAATAAAAPRRGRAARRGGVVGGLVATSAATPVFAGTAARTAVATGAGIGPGPAGRRRRVGRVVIGAAVAVGCVVALGTRLAALAPAARPTATPLAGGIATPAASATLVVGAVTAVTARVAVVTPTSALAAAVGRGGTAARFVAGGARSGSRAGGAGRVGRADAMFGCGGRCGRGAGTVAGARGRCRGSRRGLGPWCAGCVRGRLRRPRAGNVCLGHGWSVPFS